MADLFDWSQFMATPPPQVSGASMIFDAIGSVRKAKALREQQEREDAFNRWKEEQDAAGRTAALQETVRSHLADEATRQAAQGETGRHNLATESGASAALDQKKQEAMAKFLADKDFVTALQADDPASLDAYTPALRMHGLTVDDFGASASPAPQGAPAAAPAQAAPAVQPPAFSADPGGGGAPAAQPAQEPTGEQVDATGQLLRDYQPPAEGSRRISGPGGLSFMFDPTANLARAKARADAAAAGMQETAQAQSSPYMAAGTKDASKLARLYIEQGMDPVKAVEKAGAQAIQIGQQGVSMRNADVVGARGNARADQGAAHLELAKGGYAWQRAQQVFQQLGARDVIVQDRKFGQMVNQLSAGPNAATDAMLAGSFVKMAQGGTGVISDSDMRQFWDKIGGVGLKAEGIADGLISGTIPPEKRAIVLKAVQDLARTAKGNLNQIRTSLRTAMESDPNITPEMRTAVLRTYGAEPGKAEAAIQNILSKYGGGAK